MSIGGYPIGSRPLGASRLSLDADVTGAGVAAGRALSFGATAATGTGSFLQAVTGTAVATGRALSFGASTGTGTGSFIQAVTGTAVATGRALSFGASTGTGTGSFLQAVTGTGVATGRALSFGASTGTGTGSFIEVVTGTGVATGRALSFGVSQAEGAAATEVYNQEVDAGDSVFARRHETLDALIWRSRGLGSGAVEAVLSANPGLATLGPFLPEGQRVQLPDLRSSVLPPTSNLIQLWD